MKFFGARNQLDWGGVPVSRELETRHFLVVGATGSGKTVTINRILKHITAGVLAGPTRAVVYDGKTEVLSALDAVGLPEARRVILHPFDARASAWDVAKDITGPGEIQEMAHLLFPPDQTTQPFFENAATDLLNGVLMGFNENPKTCGNWTLRDVFVALSRTHWLRSVLSWSPKYNAARQELYFKNRKTSNDILATVRSKAAKYEVVAAHAWHAWKAGRKFSLDAWLRTDDAPGLSKFFPSATAHKSVVVLGHSHRSTQAVNALNRVFFHRMSQALIDEPSSESRRTWVVLDELSKAGKLEGLDLLLAKGRSKGVAAVLGFQDISGLEVKTAYGPELTEEITSQVAHKAVLRLQGAKTAKWAEGIFGHTRDVEKRTSRQFGDHVSFGSSDHMDLRPIVLDSEFFSIPTKDERGLFGFYLHPGEPGIIEHWIPPKVIAENPLNMPAQDFVPAPKEQGYLEPWTDEELATLGITKTYQGQALGGEAKGIDDTDLGPEYYR